ncbi:hypothetical protein [Parvibium lacunae]|uniref:Uncharacterized protein n=1 Tax=Parvibium lacunae TaxID=1888893 RepID=A0A368KYI9_9BURK|nr:hypothetical protein [Parvibium lacunae]RCS56493.1 hypothetical protein DU000_12265 [Parvibium lacunae]
MFTDDGASDKEATEIFTPHRSLPLTFQFMCSEKVTSFMMSPVLPLPPVIPGQFMNRRGSNLSIMLPSRDVKILNLVTLTARNGRVIRLSEMPTVEPKISETNGNFYMMLRLPFNCEEFKEGSIMIDQFDLNGTIYPPTRAILKFESKYIMNAGYLRA